MFIFRLPIDYLCVIAYIIGMLRTKENEAMATAIVLDRDDFRDSQDGSGDSIFDDVLYALGFKDKKESREIDSVTLRIELLDKY